MAKIAQQGNGTFDNLGFNPDVYAGALAHIIKVETTEEGRRESVLGQAWLAGIGKLVTCGHVVEGNVASGTDRQPNNGSLIVTFPYSGNRYPIKDIKLHPSFVRQPDGLVKFDAALLTVELHEPELSAKILPIVYEKVLPVQHALTAVRYPVHLGQYSSALNPLAQSGRLLGPLRKHDDFHLLHDTALAPGDSGAPIFDGQSLVALHCGDTASLPGLNLPTTSIRLALWVDALRELGIEGAMAAHPDRQNTPFSPALLVVAFWLCFLITMGAVSAYRAYPTLPRQATEAARSRPISITLNRAIDEYQYYQPASFNISAQSKCFVYLYGENGPNNYLRIFPNLKKSGEDLDPAIYTLSPGQSRVVDMVGNSQILVDCSPLKLHLITLISDSPPLSIGPSYEQSVVNGSTIVNFIDTAREINQARELQKAHPEQVQEYIFDGPVATKASKLKYDQPKVAK
ncbi:MAG: trypsin-like peptidase domain-containing protein [Cyanobacteria bacterium REEB67]|nr:trypsin-like peptidase domain-containing protein [Cyanobacteria bacterium REEB67]